MFRLSLRYCRGPNERAFPRPLTHAIPHANSDIRGSNTKRSAWLHSYFQASPEMFGRVQVRVLAGPLKDIQRLVPKPLLRCLGGVLGVVVLLEGEHWPQSEVLSTLEQVFIKDHSALLSSSVPRSCLVSQSLPLKKSP